MKYRIAIASTDGKVVNQHFGRAEEFYIVEADSSNMVFEYRETRKTNPVCKGGDHDDDKLEEAAKRLEDCQYILVSKIGYRAQGILEQKEIGVFELPGMISESVMKLLSYIEIQNMMQK